MHSRSKAPEIASTIACQPAPHLPGRRSCRCNCSVYSAVLCLEPAAGLRLGLDLTRVSLPTQSRTFAFEFSLKLLHGAPSSLNLDKGVGQRNASPAHPASCNALSEAPRLVNPRPTRITVALR